MNIVCITGRLTKDPEIRNAGESTIASFSIAVNRRFKDKDGNYQSDFFDVSTFGKNAEFAEKYLKKGTKVEIEGRLQQDRWTNQDGSNRSKIVIIANSVAFAESRANNQQSNSHEAPSSQKSNPKGSSGTDMGFMDVPDGIEEELPFT